MLKLTDYKGLGNAEYSDTLIGLRLSTRLHIGGKAGPSYVDVLLSGVSPLALTNALGLNYIKALGATEQRNLPSEYTQVEYLQSSGEEYIDTGITVDDTMCFDYKVSPQTSNQLSISSLANSNRTGLLVWQVSDYIQFRYRTGGNTNTYITNKKYTLNQKYNILFNENNKFYIDDELVHTKTDTIDSWGVLVTGLYDKVYGLWVKSNTDGSLKFNGIPCRRNSDNVLGMYDTVTGNFLTNAGTGDFIAGADVVPTPDNPVDIICNNGVLKVSPNLFDKNNPIKMFAYIQNSNAGEAAQIVTQVSHICIGAKVMPNTTYTITRTIPSSGFRRMRILSCTSLPVLGMSGTVLLKEDDSTALNFTFTTLSDTEYVEINISTDTNVELYNEYINTFQLEQGSTATSYMPYGKVYADGTQETVTVAGENLFDKNTVVTGYRLTNLFGKKYGNIGVDFTWADDSFVSALIPVEVGKIYTKNSPEEDAYHRFKVYDEDQNAVRITNANSITIGSGEAYIAITGYLTELDDTILRDNTINVQTANAEMLLKVGDYQDNQELLTGNITRNVGIKVLDGTENWVKTSSIRKYCSLDKTVFPNVITTSSDVICSHAIGTGYTEQGYCYLGNSYFNFNYLNATDDLDDFKQYLATQYANGTPVIVVYPLATSTTETVTGQPLTAIGNCTVTATGSLDNLSLEVSYKQGVMLRVQETENENLDNQVNVTVS